MARIGKSIDPDSRRVVAGSWANGEHRMGAHADEVSFRGDENLLHLDSGGGCTTL